LIRPGSIDHLLEVAASIPNILQRIDELQMSLTGEVTQHNNELISAAGSSLMDLTKWQQAASILIRREASSKAQDISFTSTRVMADLEWPPNPFANNYVYDSLEHAIGTLLHHTCVLLASEALFKLMENAIIHRPNTLTELTKRIHECADTICQSIPYVIKATGSPICAAMTCRIYIHFITSWYSKTNQLSKKVLLLQQLSRQKLPYMRFRSPLIVASKFGHQFI
jgi:hypothetical protein